MSDSVKAALIVLLHMGEELVQGAKLALAGDQQAFDILEEDFGSKGCAASKIERAISDAAHAMQDEVDERCELLDKIEAEIEAKRVCKGERA